MLELVRRHNTVISAALFGAIAGAEVLPFEKRVFLDIVGSGKGAEANINAFEESYRVANSGGVQILEPDAAPVFVLPAPSTKTGERLLPRISVLPSAVHEVVFRGVERLLDYQDIAYAEQFLSAVEALVAKDDVEDDYRLSREGARYLALWMAFEDIPRVAQLKMRPTREQEIRAEVKAASDQPIQVTEFFHPRVEEIAAILPISMGESLLKSSTLKGVVDAFLGPRKLRTDTVLMQLVFRTLAKLRGMRRRTLGYKHEHTMIDRWWQAVLAAQDLAMAREIVECGRMVKGYGATRHRTTTRLMVILDAVANGRAASAADIKALRDAAMTGESPEPFEAALAS